MYAANMLGMLNGLTKGMLSIAPKNADGSSVEDFYDCSLINTDGEEIKEWVAFKNFLASMPEKDGVPTLSEEYSQPEGRKNKVSLGGLERIKHPGGATIAMMILCAVVLAGIIVLDVTRKERWTKARAKRAKRRAERAAKKAEKMKTE